ncbi:MULTISPECIES: hypothetical protein [Clostridium]|uniref:Uncharacterized protein n=1 Tax=Clostridium cibarium TaxID=2762247 RepID=A0ABR8PR01_9CLOT|nr:MULTISPECIES: hypothetical protein [Clostridium]MBD7910509.1 hypothetical protein [Clostridium cibarium]
MICLFIFGFFIFEASLLIRAINKKIKKRVPLHLIGTIATLLLFVFIIQVTLGVELNSNKFITFTTAVSVMFYIIYGIDSLFVVKSK